jgi:hypothetical protein
MDLISSRVPESVNAPVSLFVASLDTYGPMTLKIILN